MQSQKMARTKLNPSLRERKRLRGKMPKNFTRYLLEKHNVNITSIPKWFRGDFNSQKLYSSIKELAEGNI